MRRRWVVTGCHGFLGRALVRHLLAEGEEVYGLDAETYAALPGSYPTPAWAYRKADIATLDRLPECDIVVNAAAETHVDNSIGDASPFLHTNVLGTQRLLDLIAARRAYRMPLLVQVSTDEVYGETGTPAPVTQPLAPRNPYAASKAAADLLVQGAQVTHGIPARIVRMTNLYGVGQYPEKLIPKAIRLVARGQTVPIHGSGEATRAWLHTEDAARAIALVAVAGTAPVYHVNGDTIASVGDVVRAIGRHLGVPDCEAPGYVRPGMDRGYLLDDTTTRALGWQPRGDFWTMLAALVTRERHQSAWWETYAPAQ